MEKWIKKKSTLSSRTNICFTLLKLNKDYYEIESEKWSYDIYSILFYKS